MCPVPNKSRFEREIDEIIDKSERETKSKPARRRQFEPFSTKAPKRRSTPNSGAFRFNPGSVIIIGVLVLAVAAFTPIAKLPLAIIGGLMVAFGYISWFRTGGSSSGRASGQSTGDRPAGDSTAKKPQVKYWRGRRIEEKPGSRGPSDSDDPGDRGKIIEFGPIDDGQEPGDRDQDEK